MPKDEAIHRLGFGLQAPDAAVYCASEVCVWGLSCGTSFCQVEGKLGASNLHSSGLQV